MGPQRQVYAGFDSRSNPGISYDTDLSGGNHVPLENPKGLRPRKMNEIAGEATHRTRRMLVITLESIKKRARSITTPRSSSS